MKAAIPVAVLLSILLSSCEVLSSTTQARFRNATSSQTVLQVGFGAASYTSPLGPGAVTGYYPIAPGENAFQAELSDGSFTSGLQFNIARGSQCTVTLSDQYSALVQFSGFTGSVTVNGVTFNSGGATSPPIFDSSNPGVGLSTCIDDPTFGVPGVTAFGAQEAVNMISTTGPISVTSAASTGTCTISFPPYVMTVSVQ